MNAERWVERETPEARARVDIVDALRRALPAYTFEVRPMLHVRATGAFGPRDLHLELQDGATAEQLVGLVASELEDVQRGTR